jgi:predicted kinase
MALSCGVVPRLILINGPPACGKSTMAQMYAAGHPLALVLDIDRVRGCLGRWREDLPSAGRAARAIALAAAREHLRAGHDVVVPQLLARPGFLTDLEHAARDTGAAFAEIVLLATKDDMLRAFADRAASARPADIAAHDLAGHPGSDADLTAMHDRLTALLATRPGAMIVPVTPGQPRLTYAAMLAKLDGRPSPAPADHTL